MVYKISLFPDGGAYSALQTLRLILRGPLCGREGEGRGGKGRTETWMEGKGEGREVGTGPPIG